MVVLSSLGVTPGQIGARLLAAITAADTSTEAWKKQAQYLMELQRQAMSNKARAESVANLLEQAYRQIPDEAAMDLTLPAPPAAS